MLMGILLSDTFILKGTFLNVKKNICGNILHFQFCATILSTSHKPTVYNKHHKNQEMQ